MSSRIDPMDIVLLLGAGLASGYLAGWLLRSMKEDVRKYRELVHEKEWDVSELYDHLLKIQEKGRSVEAEAYDYSRRFIIKGRIWSERPLKFKSMGEGKELLEREYVYLVDLTK